MYQKITITALILLLSGCATQRAWVEEWPTHRYNLARRAALPEGPRPPLRLRWKHATEGRIMYAAVADAERIYIGSRDGTLIALSHEGALLWKQTIEQGGLYQSPSLQGNEILAGKWSPYYHIYGFARSNGEKQWELESGELENRPPWVSADDKQIIYSADPPYSAENLEKSAVVALDRTSRTEQWRTILPGQLGGIATWSPTHIYVGTQSLSGNYMLAIERASGKITWTHPLTGAPTSAPILTAKAAHISSENGDIYSFDLLSGTLNWRFTLTGDHVTSDMALGGDTLYFTSHTQHLYAFDLNNREVLWKFRAPRPLGAPIVTQKHIYAGSENRMLYAWEHSGRLSSVYPTGGALTAPPIIVKDLLIIGGEDGVVYAFEEQALPTK
jgi:outer membrane protein assembly factor BamB